MFLDISLGVFLLLYRRTLDTFFLTMTFFHGSLCLSLSQNSCLGCLSFILGNRSYSTNFLIYITRCITFIRHRFNICLSILTRTSTISTHRGFTLGKHLRFHLYLLLFIAPTTFCNTLVVNSRQLVKRVIHVSELLFLILIYEVLDIISFIWLPTTLKIGIITLLKPRS